MRKAQAGIEFIIVVVTIFFLFGIIFFLTMDKRIELNDTELFVDMRSNCIRISNFINKAFFLGHGTEIVTKTNYDLVFRDNEILYTKDSGVECELIKSPINNGNATFEITKGNIKVSNKNDDIIIENV